VKAGTATRPPGGTTKGRHALTGNQIQLVIAAAHAALAEHGEDIGPSKVTRLVRRFSKVLVRNNLTFDEFLANQAHKRRLMLTDPDLALVFAYAMDPEGEKAVNHVMRERGW
jgi:hypothetical protein